MKIIFIVLDVISIIVAILGYVSIPKGNELASNWCIVTIIWIVTAFIAHMQMEN